MEAKAAIKGMELMVELGCNRVVVEGDSSVMMNGLKTKEPSLSSYGLHISDACVSENLLFELSHSQVKREGNKVAHYLVKLVVNYPDNVIWMEDIPPSIFPFVQADLATVLK